MFLVIQVQQEVQVLLYQEEQRVTLMFGVQVAEQVLRQVIYLQALIHVPLPMPMDVS